ncbi:MAG: hypothetical protein ABFC24_00265 [Methanoregulaceae archaeon]
MDETEELQESGTAQGQEETDEPIQEGEPERGEAAPDEKMTEKADALAAPPEPSSRVPDMVKQDLTELHRLLAENTGLGDQIRDLFERNLLMEGLSKETYERLVVSLQVLLGPSASRLIIESTKILTSDFFTELRKTSDESLVETVRFLQQLAAVYGTHMKDAFLLSFKYTEEDWRTAEVVAYHKGESDIWFVEMDLIKYNGERLFLRMSPVSAFQLLQTFMNEMGKIPAGTVDEQALARIRESAEQFKKRYEVPTQDEKNKVSETHLDGYA